MYEKTLKALLVFLGLSSAFNQMCLNHRTIQLFVSIIVPPVRSSYCSQEAESSSEESFPPFLLMN